MQTFIEYLLMLPGIFLLIAVGRYIIGV